MDTVRGAFPARFCISPYSAAASATDIPVTAEVERGHYSIGRVTRPNGSPVDVTLDVLEEIETSIMFDAQCSRYDALYFATDTPELLAYHA